MAHGSAPESSTLEGQGCLVEAARAVQAAHRASSRLVRLQCYEVVTVGDEPQQLFRLDVGRFADFDWTLEGAQAFQGEDDDPDRWRGEVVEVDDTLGHVYVRPSSRKARPVVGELFIRPFGFLEPLVQLFTKTESRDVLARLEGGLLLAAGIDLPGEVPCGRTLPELAPVWRRSFGAIWGPPGTGKTHLVGRQLAEVIDDPDERVLVVSTTNRATDEVALSIARAREDLGRPLAGHVLRVGSGADIQRFREAGFEELLQGGEAVLRADLGKLAREHAAAHDPEERALVMLRMRELRHSLRRASSLLGEREGKDGKGPSILVATAFLGLRAAASKSLKERFERGDGPPFTTVVIDEAGLIPRVTIAALSLLASRRVVLVGDPKQLSPIAQVSRVLPPDELRWLAESGLAHLEVSRDGTLWEHVHLLKRQHRMHPAIRAVVSDLQYGGALEDAPEVKGRGFFYDKLLRKEPKAIWYVLDEEGGDRASLRAERDVASRSWVRRRSPDLVDKVLRHHPRMAAGPGLFITPFVAQARELNQLFAERGLTGWSASTTHRQQGAEADYVIFDTVNASSTAWPHEEWKRLLNVGMSRARHLLVVLATQDEMREPYMRALAKGLAPRVLRAQGGQWAWHPAPRESSLDERGPSHAAPPGSLGAQLASRKAMRPILSAEQERLCALKLDGRPRLVRGVAGSGKTVVLASWLAKSLATDDPGPFWVVYGNAALRGLLQESIEAAWPGQGSGRELPWHRVELFHAGELFVALERELGPSLDKRVRIDPFEYDERARRLLDSAALEPRCRAMFIDEAQDLGPSTLELLARLVEPSIEGDPRSRSLLIFYDNAQDVYRRGTPRWAELGLDMRGRSTVMKESFRSTKPILELALNVLYRLRPPAKDPDHDELVARGLLELETRHRRDFWRVRHNHVGGPRPIVRAFRSRAEELAALARAVRRFIVTEGVLPRDICVVAHTEGIRETLVGVLEAELDEVDVGVEVRTRRAFTRSERTVVVTTAHSYKGYEAEVVLVPAADRFVASRGGIEEPLASALYVAMTRARSLLYVSSTAAAPRTAGDRVHRALHTAFEDLLGAPEIGDAASPLEQRIELFERTGREHRAWLRELLARYGIERGPIRDEIGRVVAEPLFSFVDEGRRYACFVHEVSDDTKADLEVMGVRVLHPGERPADVG